MFTLRKVKNLLIRFKHNSYDFSFIFISLSVHVNWHFQEKICDKILGRWEFPTTGNPQHIRYFEFKSNTVKIRLSHLYGLGSVFSILYSELFSVSIR